MTMINRKLIELLLLSTLLGSALFAAPTGKIAGIVKDKATRQPLVAANVFIIGTSLGTSTDADGNFVITSVPPGDHSVRVSYIGYTTVVDSTVRVTEDQITNLHFDLEPAALENAPVIVSAQALGQNQAINTQLQAGTIMNVVSAARIQELPDANAAESVGRLPGVSILRTGGEGNKIVVRGLQPKYNAVMIDGIRIASSDANDRSADLSLISPYSLESIEVTKVVTPDMDPDVIGGTVNFRMREAKEEAAGLRVNLLAQQGYTGLSDAYDKYRNYKYVGSVEGRFFDDQSLGLFAQGDIERRNLTSNELGAVYSQAPNSTTDYLTNGLNLNYVARDRERENGTLFFDYRVPDWTFGLSNFLSTGITDGQSRLEHFDVTSSPLHDYDLAYRKTTVNLITNILTATHSFSIFNVTAKLAHTYSETKNPNEWLIGFRSPDQNLSQFVGKTNLNPAAIPPAAGNDTSKTFLNTLLLGNDFSRERALTAGLDISTNLDLPSMDANAVVKIGGKYRHQTRSNVHSQSGGDGVGLTSARYIDSLIASHFASTQQYAGTTPLPAAPFLDPNFSYGQFLSGDYPMVFPLNYSMLSDLASFVDANAARIEQNDAIAWAYDKFNSTTFNYDGYENQSAAYAMTTINLGSSITLIPGVRYQDIKTTYTASQGKQDNSSSHGGPYQHYDTTVALDHSYWLPDVIMKYKPVSWLDVRLAYTNTLSLPDYNAIVPRIDASLGGTLAWNNTQLRPTRSRNFDAYASFYDNSIGLFTVGGFLKRIDDLIFPASFFVNDSAAKPYYPQEYVGSTTFKGTYNVTTFENLPNRIDDYGLELDWQTHFWYLPHPLDGLVLNINYTHVHSNSDYPYVLLVKSSIPHGKDRLVDTSYSAPLLYQPDRILNISVGYDFQDFSIRVSMLYQSEIFTGTAVSPVWLQLHTFTAASTRWDVAIKQTLPWFGVQLFGDLNNFNGAKDVSVIQASTGVPNSQQSYGLNGDIGLRWHL